MALEAMPFLRWAARQGLAKQERAGGQAFYLR